MTPKEIFYAELGREISAYAEKTKPNPYDSVEKYSKQIEKVVQRMMYGIICYLHVTN